MIFPGCSMLIYLNVLLQERRKVFMWFKDGKWDREQIADRFFRTLIDPDQFPKGKQIGRLTTTLIKSRLAVWQRLLSIPNWEHILGRQYHFWNRTNPKSISLQITYRSWRRWSWWPRVITWSRRLSWNCHRPSMSIGQLRAYVDTEPAG